MIEIVYTPKFVRNYGNLSSNLQLEADEKIALFRADPKHPFLKTHKLKGLKNFWSFWVNYHYRIIFQFDSKTVAALLTVGPHDLYDDL